MSNYAHPEVLVDTEWLVAHGNDAHVRLIEIDATPQVYAAGHIQNAVFWNSTNTVLRPNRRVNDDPHAFADLMARSGIANATTVVLYSNGLATAGWAFWFLKLFSHADVRVLNGSRKKWLLENRPLTTIVPIITPATYQVPAADGRLRALRGEVEAALGTPEVLLDVRTTQEYTGEWFAAKPPVEGERAGHLPGATHIFYERNLNPDGTFKSYAELNAMYDADGVTRDKVVTTY